MNWKKQAISKMETCHGELTSYFMANEWLKPYSQTSGKDRLDCKDCDWTCSCKVCKTVVTELQNF